MKQKLWGVIAIFVACLAISCVTENTLPQNLKMHVESNSTIPVERAIENLNSFLVRHNQETKAMGVGISDVMVVSSQNVTRSNGESLPAIDSLLYLVNFENNSGYAILSADERIGAPIIAVTETGSINAQAFNLNNRDLGNGTTSSDDFSLDLPIGNPDPSDTSIGGSQIVNDMIVEFVNGRVGNEYNYVGGNDNTPPADNTSPYWVAPILTTIWGQGTPYNLKCPAEENGEHNPAGCVAIALGQVIAHFEAERTDVSKEYDWQVIKSVGKMEDWQAIKNDVKSYNNTQKDEISTFIRDLGDMCCMDYDDGGSSSLPWKIDNCLQDFGFKESELYWFYDSESIIESLWDANPVIISGARTDCKGGHTWVIDGYDYTTNTDDDNNILFHCNWGWNGMCNGFYFSKVFNPSANAEIYDSNYGDYADSNDLINSYYGWMFSRVIINRD